MAEAALFGVAKSILTVLASPALDEFRLLWCHKAQLEKLADTVTTIRDVLHDADRRQASDAAVQGWLARLRVALYEADDLFDMISAKVLHDKAMTGSKIGKKVRGLVLSKPYHFAFVVKTAHKVKDIRKRLDDIARDIKGFGFLLIQTDQQDQPFRIKREQTHSYIPSNEVIGRDQEREDIVKKLLSEYCYQGQNGVYVVVVIGIGGMGKTTLAQFVYNDERVQKGFDLCMWVCVNYLSHLKQVLLALIKSARNSTQHKDLDTDQLQSLFRKQIEGKRFLLVLDDVWDEDPQNWHKLKVLLDCGKSGSMILATTRSEVVAQSLSATKPYYHLRGLSDQSAWLLFKKMAFPEGEEQHGEDIEALGRQIVKKCAHVPLAIATVAGLLRHKEKKRWLPLVNDQLSKAVPGEYNKIMQILKFSYDELPYLVKSCFAYCSLFPKDYEFERQVLVRIWIAQGFVESCSVSQSLEDIAEDYFMCLVERCFFQDMEMETRNGVRIYTCRMHDLVHDLAMEVAGSESSLVDETTQSSWDKTLRHISSICESKSFVDRACSFSHAKSLRTFLCPSLTLGISMEKINLHKLMSSFKVLRVLNLDFWEIKEMPFSIGKLIHLRYLDLTWNDMESLPSSICNLHHLQSLILQGCSKLKELPKDLGKLLSLRHLLLEDCDKLSQMPPGLAALTSLVTLDKVVVQNPRGGLRYLECLNNLSGSLEIVLPGTGWKNATMDAQRSRLSRKDKLDALHIKFKESDAGVEDLLELDTLMSALEPNGNLEYLRIRDFVGKEMSPWVMGLHNLVTLELESCGRFVELPSLSRLQSLKELSIKRMDSMFTIEGSMTSYDPGLFFPSLETLCIEDMPNLESWWLQAPEVLPTFPRVTKVEIRRCPKLTSSCMPLFPLVEDLKLEDVKEEVIWQGIGSEATGLACTALKRLDLNSIQGLSNMGEAQIRHLSSLQVLNIGRCSELETVACKGLAYLTSLEDLSFWRCRKLRWVDGKKPEVPWGHLRRLRNLHISNVKRSFFKGLKYMASLEGLAIESFNEELQSVSTNNEEEEEEEDGMPWKPLQKLSSMVLRFGMTFSMRGNQQLLKGVEFLTSLRALTLRDCKELYLSWRALLSLTHLESLRIEKVEKVIEVEDNSTAAHQMSQISTLRELTIEDCSGEWVHDDIIIPWKSFPSLRYLRLYRIRELEGLPDGIQHLPALEGLKIYRCEGVVSLPYWITSLSSLRELEIGWSSEELKKRCKRVTGEDWPLIQHIEDIDIR